MAFYSEDLVDEIMQGQIADGKTQTAIMKVYFMLQKNNRNY